MRYLKKLCTRHVLLSVAAVMIFGSAIFIAIFVHKEPADTYPAASRNNHPEPLMTGFQFTEYSQGKKYFTVDAEKFYLRNKKVNPLGFRIALGKCAELENVKVVFYADNRPVSYLTSRTAILDSKNKDMVFQGKPLLITEDKRVMEADTIGWNNADRRLVAYDHCMIGAEGTTRRADSISTDAALRDVTIGHRSPVPFKLKGS